ncbi:EF-hand domain-containing protein [Novosphingobium resinovorum]|uniref:EF-hand domain-containing protein n=1 Tax=Novosphingobium resinovorum TaxID=158500 RepID=UPI002ED607AA|nr:EF-hand domain-containing protein [Novosphingobium resinovorum]
MTTIKTLLLGLSATALTIGGVACAQAPAAPKKDAASKAERTHVETRAEAQARATEMFARLDVNKDGKLDKADRELARQQMREKIFAKLDTNGDGAISKAEFMADKGPEGRGPDGRGRGPDGRGPGPDGMDGPPPPPPGDAGPDGAPPPPGDGMDRGHGGPRGHGMMGRGPGKFGGRFDGDRDGSVTQAEFVAAALKRFDAQDTNHDGKVTPEERKAAHEARKAEWQAKRADKKPAN